MTFGFALTKSLHVVGFLMGQPPTLRIAFGMLVVAFMKLSIISIDTISLSLESPGELSISTQFDPFKRDLIPASLANPFDP